MRLEEKLKLDNIRSYTTSDWGDCGKESVAPGRANIFLRYLILQLGTLVGLMICMTLDMRLT